jgi:Tfp pilus assembly ATPase PilU
VPESGDFASTPTSSGTIAFAIRTVPHRAKSIGELNLPAIVDDIAMLPRGLSS